AWRGLRAAAAVERALDQGLGPGWRSALDPEAAARLRPPRPPPRIPPAPPALPPPGVGRGARLRSGAPGRGDRLGRYPPRPPPPRLPRPGVPARRRLPQRPQGQRGPPPPLPAGEPGVGLRRRQLPPAPGRALPRPARRRQAGHRLGAGPRPRVRR